MAEGEGPKVREEVRIPVSPGPPIHVPNYRAALVERDFIKTKIAELLKKKIIRPVKSEWSSPILLVPKAGKEKFRLCIDYRRLNTRIPLDTYPLGNIEDLLTRAGTAKIFSKIDLASGFHQVPVHPEDQHYLAFTTEEAAYTYAYIPFGLNVAPALFTRALNAALEGCRPFILIYVDDILVISQSLEEHLIHLHKVLTALGKANFRVSVPKTILGVVEIPYLGHILRPGQVCQDPGKITAILDHPIPTTLKGLQRFLGMTSYYRRFIRNYGKIAEPLFPLLSTKGRLQLSPVHVDAIQKLKDTLTKEPVLEQFISSRPTRVEVDSCATGVGAVLSQKVEGHWKPVAFYSKRFPGAARTYASRELEALGIYLSVVHWRVWLLGHPFTIISDHESLVLSSHCKNSRRIQKWLLGLSEYTYTIVYRRGILHTVPDALSRGIDPGAEDGDQTDPELGIGTSTAEIQALTEDKEEVKEDSSDDEDEPLVTPELDLGDINYAIPSKYEWKQATLRCHDLAVIAHLLAGNLDDKFASRAQAAALIKKYDLRLEQGIITDPIGIKWVPGEYRALIIGLFHSSPFTAHLDSRRTQAQMRATFFWPTMASDTDVFIRSCVECRVVKGLVPSVEVQQQQVIPIPFEAIAIDHAGPLETTSSGKKYILLIIDLFSGFPEAIAVASLHAQTTARELINFFCRFGWPKYIVSDKGSSFKNALIRELSKATGLKQKFTTVRHPAANGSAERLVRTVKTALDVLQKKHSKTWDQVLPQVLLALRQAPRAPLWLSPSQIIFGRQMVGPAERVSDWDDTVEYAPAGSWIFQRLRVYRETRLLLQEQLQKTKEEKERKTIHKVAELPPGSLVLVFNHSSLVKHTHGIPFRWVGPYVLHRSSGISTRHVLINGKIQLLHASRVLPYDPAGLPDQSPTKEKIDVLRREHEAFLRLLAAESKYVFGRTPEEGVTDPDRKEEVEDPELPDPEREGLEDAPLPVAETRNEAPRSSTPRRTEKVQAPPTPVRTAHQEQKESETRDSRPSEAGSALSGSTPRPSFTPSRLPTPRVSSTGTQDPSYSFLQSSDDKEKKHRDEPDSSEPTTGVEDGELPDVLSAPPAEVSRPKRRIRAEPEHRASAAELPEGMVIVEIKGEQRLAEWNPDGLTLSLYGGRGRVTDRYQKLYRTLSGKLTTEPYTSSGNCWPEIIQANECRVLTRTFSLSRGRIPRDMQALVTRRAWAL